MTNGEYYLTNIFEGGAGLPVGTGAAPVFFIDQEAGLLIAEAVARAEDVVLRMYQELPRASAVDGLRDFLASSNAAGWTMPDTSLDWVKEIATESGSEPYKADPQAGLRLCYFSFFFRCTPDGEIGHISLSLVGLHNALSEDIAGLARLESLDLTLSNILGPLPSALGALVSLRSLIVVNNPGLAGTPLPDLARLENLMDLEVTNCGVTGALPSFAAMRRLAILDLRGNALSGPAPALTAAWAGNLEILDLSENAISGPIDAGGAGSFENAPRLRVINLGGNRLTGAIPASLGSLPLLTELWAQDNRLSGPLPPEIATATSLRDLNLGGNNLDSPLPPLAGLSALSSLRISGSALTGALPWSLPPRLVHLDLSHNNFTAFAPPGSWAGLTSLRAVHLRGNAIAGPQELIPFVFPPSRDQFTGMRVLDLRDNSLRSASRGATVLDLTSYPSIREVRLANNSLHGLFIINSIGTDQPEIRHLDVSDNPDLVGGLQDNIADIPLTHLDIRGTSIMQNLYADGIFASPSGRGREGPSAPDAPVPEPGTAAFDDEVRELRRHAAEARARAVESRAGAANAALLDRGSNFWAAGAVGLVNETVEVATEDDLRNLRSLLAQPISQALALDGTSRYLDESLGMWCPTLRGVRTHDGERMEVLADPTYHNAAYCLCPAGQVRVPGNRCHPCPENVKCPGFDAQLDMTVSRGYYPIPDWERPVQALRCHSSILSSTPCNPDELPSYTCAAGYTGRLCAECEDTHFSRNGICIECGGIGIAVVAVGVASITLIFAIFAVRLRRSVLQHRDVLDDELYATPPRPSAVGAEAAAAADSADESCADKLNGGGGVGGGVVGGGGSAWGPSVSQDKQRAFAATFAAAGRGADPPVNMPPRAMTIISIILFYTQTLSISLDGFVLPDTLAVLKELYDLSNLSITSLGARCVVGALSFQKVYLISWLVPLGIGVLMWLVAGVLVAVPGVSASRPRIVRTTGAMSLVLLTLVYFPMSTRSLAKVSCLTDPVTGVDYLRSNPAIRCDAISAAGKAIPIALYPAGGYAAIIALSALIAARKRRLASAGHPSAIVSAVPPFARWFFLAFRDSFWWMAPVLFGRRFVVAAVVSLTPVNSAMRYAIVAIVIIASAAATIHLRPYRTVAGNRLDSVALLSSSIIYVTSFIAANDNFETTDVLIVFIVVLHLGTIGVFVFAAFMWARGTSRRRRRGKESGGKGRDAVLPFSADDADTTNVP